MKRRRVVEVRVPASTSNLGAGFDCFGLALKLYLTVRATVATASNEPCRVRTIGEGRARVSPSTDNLIFRAMRAAAEKWKLELPPVRLAVSNEIPLGSGLGSSAAAIVAGVSLSAMLCGVKVSDEAILNLATELEGHPDNVAAAVSGGWVVNCLATDGRVLVVKKRWPAELKIIVVTPDVPLDTKSARAVLTDVVRLSDAVFNLQRAALFGAALDAGRYDLLWEAMKDRLHQTRREHLVPGLAEALAVARLPGLCGLALSGAGPSVLALAEKNFDEIGDAIAHGFRRHQLETTVRLLEVDENGVQRNEE